MEQALHIFSYLRSHHNAEMIFDPSEPEFDMNVTFPREDWSDKVYGEIQEELPHNIPETRGFGFKIVIYIDIDHSSFKIRIHCLFKHFSHLLDIKEVGEH